MACRAGFARVDKVMRGQEKKEERLMLMLMRGPLSAKRREAFAARMGRERVLSPSVSEVA